METTAFDLGRSVFLSAESAAVDDFSLVTDAHLAAAIAYGDSQSVLLARSKKVLRLLKAEQSRRQGSRS